MLNKWSVAAGEWKLFSSIRCYLVRSTREAVLLVDADEWRFDLDEMSWHRKARDPGWIIIDTWPPPTIPSCS